MNPFNNELCYDCVPLNIDKNAGVVQPILFLGP